MLLRLLSIEGPSAVSLAGFIHLFTGTAVWLIILYQISYSSVNAGIPYSLELCFPSYACHEGHAFSLRHFQSREQIYFSSVISIRQVGGSMVLPVNQFTFSAIRCDGDDVYVYREQYKTFNSSIGLYNALLIIGSIHFTLFLILFCLDATGPDAPTSRAVVEVTSFIYRNLVISLTSCLFAPISTTLYVSNLKYNALSSSLLVLKDIFLQFCSVHQTFLSSPDRRYAHCT